MTVDTGAIRREFDAIESNAEAGDWAGRHGRALLDELELRDRTLEAIRDLIGSEAYSEVDTEPVRAVLGGDSPTAGSTST